MLCVDCGPPSKRIPKFGASAERVQLILEPKFGAWKTLFCRFLCVDGGRVVFILPCMLDTGGSLSMLVCLESMEKVYGSCLALPLVHEEGDFHRVCLA